jgi:hypothetical protein
MLESGGQHADAYGGVQRSNLAPTVSHYLIEVKHGDEHEACVRALQAIEQYGSHLKTHAEWGREDGHHACWLIAELEDCDDAMRMVPPEFRPETTVIALNRFTKEQIAQFISELESQSWRKSPESCDTGRWY